MLAIVLMILISNQYIDIGLLDEFFWWVFGGSLIALEAKFYESIGDAIKSILKKPIESISLKMITDIKTKKVGLYIENELIETYNDFNIAQANIGPLSINRTISIESYTTKEDLRSFPEDYDDLDTEELF
jgi:hypothetical protein